MSVVPLGEVDYNVNAPTKKAPEHEGRHVYNTDHHLQRSAGTPWVTHVDAALLVTQQDNVAPPQKLLVSRLWLISVHIKLGLQALSLSKQSCHVKGSIGSWAKGA